MSEIDVQCSCGKLRVTLAGEPIISAECHCTSCRQAGAKIVTLPGIPTFLEPNGGTHFVLYRKDRVRFTEGMELLREFRLSPKAKTRRVVASCCNTPVFLDFQGGHWLSIYACLWQDATRPVPALRTMTMDLPDKSVLSDDVRNCKRQSLSFFGKLFTAWVAMGFRSPKIVTGGELEF